MLSRVKNAMYACGVPYISAYTPWAIKKRRATLFGIITSMFRGGFLHFLHQWKQEKMLYRGITKFATLPQLCLYST